MQAGRESQTAIMVCEARAAAHGTFAVGRFEDPTALHLLPEKARAEVERFHAGTKPRGPREGFARGSLEARAKMMALRTVELDDAVRTAAKTQLVILGAGLDGRAWRMRELRDVTVFEVDHPDSQRVKRERVAGLTQTAREVRFVPVDFTRDELDRALQAAGHDPAQPTMWIWEGVVMYLSPEEVEATLAVIARRSAPDSRLAIVYHAPGALLWIIKPILRRAGEPLRSVYTADKMRALLQRHGFRVLSDDDTPGLARRLAPELQQGTRMMKHIRAVTAVR